MSLNINYQNIKVPFPPTISVDEIVNIHLKNGIENGNKTMNAFMIYRKEYNNIEISENLNNKKIKKKKKKPIDNDNNNNNIRNIHNIH
ncbi:12352_t:CDS:1, partial [Dentiscutata erythropus]